MIPLTFAVTSAKAVVGRVTIIGFNLASFVYQNAERLAFPLSAVAFQTADFLLRIFPPMPVGRLCYFPDRWYSNNPAW